MENETKENETITLTKEEHKALLHSIGKLQRKFEIVAQTLFKQADMLRPRKDTEDYSHAVDFGGLCYLSAAAEMQAVYMSIDRLSDKGSWDFDKNLLHYFD